VNPWQLSQQLKHELATITWPGGSVVFGPRSVFIYAGAVPADEEMPPAFPFAAISIGSSTADDAHPDLVTQSFTVGACVEVAGDPLGEFAIIGSSRASLGSSAGAGIAEVTERVRAALNRLTIFDGASIVVSGTGTTAVATPIRGRHVAAEELSVQALCSSAPFYAAPQQIRRNGNIVSWVGPHCSSRFDFLRYRFGYVTGTVPATSPAGLTSVIYTGTAREAAATIVPGRVYQVFADYDPRGTGSPAASSEPVVGSYFTT